MHEPGSIPYKGINLTKIKSKFVAGDLFLVMPEKATGRNVGEVIDYFYTPTSTAMSLKLLERHACGAEEFLIISVMKMRELERGVP
jgi:hypothetical protein